MSEWKKAFLSTSAEFWVGMSTAWTFAAIDSVNRLAWLDLLSSLWLAILAFSVSIGIKVKLSYAKRA